MWLEKNNGFLQLFPKFKKLLRQSTIIENTIDFD